MTGARARLHVPNDISRLSALASFDFLSAFPESGGDNFTRDRSSGTSLMYFHSHDSQISRRRHARNRKRGVRALRSAARRESISRSGRVDERRVYPLVYARVSLQSIKWRWCFLATPMREHTLHDCQNVSMDAVATGNFLAFISG